MRPYANSGGVVIFHGDARKIVPALDRVDHVISDPPFSQRVRKGARTSARHGAALVDFDDAEAGIDEVIRSAFASGARWAVMTVDYMKAFEWETTPPDGWRQFRIGVWNKKGTGAPQLSGDRPAMGWEAIAHLYRIGERPRWNGGGLDSVYSVPIVRRPKATDRHPTEKPVALYETFVSRFTDRGETILDPWAGSGTTGVAARNLGRRCVLIEKEERWCEMAAKRLGEGSQPELAFRR